MTPDGGHLVAVTLEAVYENGVLKPAGPRPWNDGERVAVAVGSLDSPILSSVRDHQVDRDARGIRTGPGRSGRTRGPAM